MTVGDSNSFAVADYLSGDPAPTVTLTTDAPSGDYLFENGDFTYHPTSSGIYTFAFTASNVLGTATADLTVTVTGGDTPVSDYEQWLIDNNYPKEPEGTIATNGYSYYENYIADIDPTSTNFLEVSFASTTNGTLSIVPFSTNRTYQLLYWTDFDAAPTTNTLTPTNLSFPTNATGFGRLRVTLPAPSSP